jgi:deazaflavin-dependent oxidoreductase (nitroreductase family)
MKPGRRQNALDRWYVRTYTRFDVAVFKRFGRSPMARFMAVDVLLLRTIGRRTGTTRENLVAYIEDGDSLLVGGGNWGWDHDPGWLYNIAARPTVEVVRARETTRMRGTVLEGDEREKASQRLAEAYPHSQVYLQRRVRPIPAVRLQPVD